MTELLHNGSPARPAAGSLLRAAGTVRVLTPDDAADTYVNDLCAHVFLAGIERQGLRHVHRVEIEREKGTFADLHRHGRMELSWRTSAGEDAVVSLPDGELALLVGWRGGCEIVVAGRDHAAVRRASGRLVRFRVDDLDAVVSRLREAGIKVHPHDREYPNGRFAELADPEGNPIQLWEPNAASLARDPGQRT